MDDECARRTAQALSKMKERGTQYLSAQEWGTQLRTAIDDHDHAQAIETLVALIEGHCSPAHAARIITTTYSAQLSQENGITTEDHDLKINHFWDFYLLEAVQIFGSAAIEDRLADLLVEMSRQPDVKSHDGSVKTHGNGAVWWRDLPKWSYWFLEHGISYDNWYTPEELDEYLEQGPRLLNTTRFAARLLSKGEAIFALPYVAGHMLGRGLERDHFADDPDLLESHEWRLLIPAATTWLLIAGNSIYEHILSEERGTKEGSDQNQKEWSKGSWTMQRWCCWKQQLQSFSERTDFNDEYRGYAAETLVKMAEVERQYEA